MLSPGMNKWEKGHYDGIMLSRSIQMLLDDSGEG